MKKNLLTGFCQHKLESPGKKRASAMGLPQTVLISSQPLPTSPPTQLQTFFLFLQNK